MFTLQIPSMTEFIVRLRGDVKGTAQCKNQKYIPGQSSGVRYVNHINQARAGGVRYVNNIYQARLGGVRYVNSIYQVKVFGVA